MYIHKHTPIWGPYPSLKPYCNYCINTIINVKTNTYQAKCTEKHTKPIKNMTPYDYGDNPYKGKYKNV